MTETTAEFAKRMIETRGYIRSDYRWMFGRSTYGSHQMALSIFMAIKDQCVYKKLSGQSNPIMANGQEIREAVTGETHSYASYWLRKPEIESAFDLLKKVGLIKETTRNRGPYGYGDDREFWLTVLSATIIKEAKQNADIRQAILNVLAESNNPYKIDSE
jgi:hypothetical protein